MTKINPEDKANNERVEEQKAQRLYTMLNRLFHPYAPARLTEVDITEIRIRGPRQAGDQVLVITKAREEQGQYVTFHAADSAEEALKGALERLVNKQAKWREDKPYQG